MNKSHSISAASQSLREVFSASEYIIPDFQRPYSWEEEHCERLWEDLLKFWESSSSQEEKYFLGSIVTFRTKDAKKLKVIDGQQRLITIALLMKALFMRDNANRALEICIKTTHPHTAEVEQKSRIKSEVIESDDRDIVQIIKASENELQLKKGKLYDNFRCLQKGIREWEENSNDFPRQLEEFIGYLLDRVILLPIECAEEDEGLDIFVTINDRGMQLEDSHIFKAKIYQKFKKDQDREKFKEDWNELKEPQQAFRDYMYVLRAEDSDTSKERKLRTYYLKDKWKKVSEDPNKLMDNIRKIDRAAQWVEKNVWWQTLGLHTQQYWRFPILTYLHKHGELDEVNAFELKGKDKDDAFNKLCVAVTQYFFFKSLMGRTINRMKLPTFQVCIDIAKGKSNVTKAFEDDINKELEEIDRDRNQLKKRFEVISSRYNKGLLAIANLNSEDSDQLPPLKTLHVEHILPKKWDNSYYDQWNEESVKKAMNKLGNLLLLEEPLNIKGSNEFFAYKKKKSYQYSKVPEAVKLANDPKDEWTYNLFEERHKETVERLLEFFLE